MTHSLGSAPPFIGYLDKRLPSLPNAAIEIDEGCSRPIPRGLVVQCDPARATLNPRERIPQFRQSRRWARIHAWAQQPPSPPHLLHPKGSVMDGNSTIEDVTNQQLSKREIFFGQQRALPRHAIVKSQLSVAESKRPLNNRSISGGSSNSRHDSSSRISTAERWRFAKPIGIRLPRPSTSGWRHRRSKSRKATPVRRPESASRPSSALSPFPNGMRTVDNDQLVKRNSTMSTEATSIPQHERSMLSVQQ